MQCYEIEPASEKQVRLKTKYHGKQMITVASRTQIKTVIFFQNKNIHKIEFVRNKKCFISWLKL